MSAQFDIADESLMHTQYLDDRLGRLPAFGLVILQVGSELKTGPSLALFSVCSSGCWPN